MALNKPAGLLRSNFGFTHLKCFDADTWRQVRQQAAKQIRKAKPATIIATDIDLQAVKAARQNARTAGVEQLIEFNVCDFADTRIPPEKGMVLLNPEYGNRLGQCDELLDTYKRIGDFFKQSCAGYQGFVFTGNMDLAKKIGLKTSARIPFFNGNIECRLLKYELYEGSKKNR